MEGLRSVTLCRICLEDGAEIPIFETKNSEDPNVYSKLIQCLGEKIEDIDGYPRNICKLCHTTLNSVTNLIKQYKDSARILQQMVVKQEIIELCDFSCNEQSEIEIENIKIEPKIEFSNAEEFIKLIKPLQSKIKKKIKKEPKSKKGKAKILSSNKINKIASSILEGDFLWTGEKWCNKSPSTAIKKVISRRKIDKKPEKSTIKILKERKPRESALCDLCGETFKDKERLGLHKRKVHIKTNVKCPICSKECHSEYYLKRHLRRKHTETEKNYVCSACGKQFAFKGEMNSHYKSVHDKKRKKIFPCKLCDKMYACAKSVLIHERSVHTGERPAVCSVCNSRFYHEDYLKEHMRLHTGETPFKCPICGRGYAQRGNMKSHIRHVHRRSQIDELTLSTLKPNYLRLLRV